MEKLRLPVRTVLGVVAPAEPGALRTGAPGGRAPSTNCKVGIPARSERESTLLQVKLTELVVCETSFKFNA